MQKKHLTVPLTVLALALVGTGVGLGLSLTSPQPSWAAAVAGKVHLKPHWKVGESRTYSLEMTMAGKASLATALAALAKQGKAAGTGKGEGAQPAAAPAQVIEASLQGELTFTALAAVNGGTKLVVDFSKTRMSARVDGQEQGSGAGESAQGQKEDPRADLKKVLVDVDGQGAFKAVRFAPGLTLLERNHMRTLLSLVQVVFPANPGGSWNGEESDMNGPFRASYQTRFSLLPSETVVLRKDLARDGNVLTRMSGSLRINFDAAAGRVTGIEGARTTESRMGEAVVGEDAVRLAFSLSAVKQAPAAEPDWVKIAASELPYASGAAVVGTLEGKEETRELQKSLLRKELGDDTRASLLALTSEIAHEDDPRALKTYLKLAALLTLDPDAANGLQDTLATLHWSSLAFRNIATALTKAGTPQAQEALREGIALAQGGKGDARAAQQLVVHLGMVAVPTTESEEFMRGLAFGAAPNDVGDTALLALGNMGHALREGVPQRAQRIQQELARVLPQESDFTRRELLLAAIGNVGVADQVPVVAPFLSDARPSTRAKAARALRHVDTQDVKETLARTARSDASETVRAHAVEALAHTPGDAGTLAAYRAILETERSVPVLKETARNLSLMAATDAGARRVLEDFAAVCAHPELRPYVKNLVHAL